MSLALLEDGQGGLGYFDVQSTICESATQGNLVRPPRQAPARRAPRSREFEHRFFPIQGGSFQASYPLWCLHDYCRGFEGIETERVSIPRARKKIRPNLLRNGTAACIRRGDCMCRHPYATARASCPTPLYRYVAGRHPRFGLGRTGVGLKFEQTVVVG